MAVSQTQENILQLLKYCGITQEAAMAIMFMLETEEQQEAMLSWMIQQKEPPTEQELLKMAVEITE